MAGSRNPAGPQVEAAESRQSQAGMAAGPLVVACSGHGDTCKKEIWIGTPCRVWLDIYSVSYGGGREKGRRGGGGDGS